MAEVAKTYAEEADLTSTPKPNHLNNFGDIHDKGQSGPINKDDAPAPSDITLNHPYLREQAQRIQPANLVILKDLKSLGIDLEADGKVDYLAPLNGKKTGPMFSELRKWRAENLKATFEETGEIVQQLLDTHFGPYNEAVADALDKQRPIKERIAELEEQKERLNAKFLAATEYQKSHGHNDNQQINSAYMGFRIASDGPAPSKEEMAKVAEKMRVEQVREQTSKYFYAKTYLQKNDSNFENKASIDSDPTWQQTVITRANVFSKSIISSNAESLKLINAELKKLQASVSEIKIPEIPGETFNPTNLDAIEYGKSTCRHRAPLAYLMFKDCGFPVELVYGDLKRLKAYGPHMFVDAEEHGIFEASHSGRRAIILQKHGHVKGWNGKEDGALLPNVVDCGPVDYRYTLMTGHLGHPITDEATPALKAKDSKLAEIRKIADEKWKILHAVDPDTAQKPEALIPPEDLRKLAMAIAPQQFFAATNMGGDAYIEHYIVPEMSAAELGLLRAAQKDRDQYFKAMKQPLAPKTPSLMKALFGDTTEFSDAMNRHLEESKTYNNKRKAVDNVVDAYYERGARERRWKEEELIREYCKKTGLYDPTNPNASLTSYYALVREEAIIIAEDARKRASAGKN